MLYYSVMEHVVNRPKLKKPQYADCYDRTYKIRFHNCRIRQDATDPKQKAVTDLEEQVDRPPTTTGRVKSGEAIKPQRT